MIKLVDVNKRYKINEEKKHKDVINGINLEIDPGEFVIFIGKSGAGKSTLLKMITGEERSTSGEVWLEDIRVDKIKSEFLPYLRRKIGVIFQDFKLLSTRTVFENVSLAMEVAGVCKKEVVKKVPELLKQVGIADKAHYYPNELSGGEKQRVSIARALSHDPVLLIADEPTGNLDKTNTYEIMTLLLKINNLGTTVLLTTHDQEVVDKLRKRVITIKDGQISMDQEIGSYYI